jgi:hypothetical protein
MSVEMLTFTSGAVFWEQYNARQVPLDLDFQANTLLCAPSRPSLRTSLYCFTVVSRRTETSCLTIIWATIQDIRLYTISL